MKPPRSDLGALGRTARALVSAVTLPELARAALEEMCGTLGFDVAALYLPAGDGRPALERLAAAGDTREPCERLVFDAEAWRLAVQGDAPLVMRDRGAWLMDHPFSPPAESWLVLPLGDRLGVVIAEPAGMVTPESGAVLRLLGDLLGAGVATARLRQELQRTALERERMRLAAEVHDGLAQDLALAMRELALLETEPAPEVAEASRARLRAAVAEAHRIVRSRLMGMVAPPALGGLRPALEELCERFAHRGLEVRLDGDADLPALPPPVAAAALRVLAEALTNAERHAGAGHAVLEARSTDGRLELVVGDDGRGFTAAAGPGEGHFGLLLMHERARAAGGTLTVDSVPGRGTRVALDLPLPPT
ncbi:MAG TPA: ATP-binding protein [Solirubrobacteraceae bacterium]|nr:ATP-binding protein [Solirubrobacteraceae bacterium]